MAERPELEKHELPSNDISVKRRKKGMRKNLSNLLNEYSRSSTLHGLRYVTERQLTAYEKVFWLLTFLVSVTICIVVIVNLYIKWKSNPVIVTINENIISASKIPFPSITICPQSKCRASAFNYSAARRALEKHYFKGSSRATLVASIIGRRKRSAEVNSNSTMKKKFSNIATVCEGNDMIMNKLLDYDEDPSDASLVKDVRQVAHNHYEVFFRCIWRGRKTSDCGYLFKYVLTREGVCFNMNTIAASKILNLNSLQTDYIYMHKHYDTDNQPLKYGRINGAGPDLDIVLTTNLQQRDKSCNTLNNGFKIYMQNPNDLPAPSRYHYSALDSQSTSLAIKCNIMNTSVDLKDNPPEERQCYFEGEKNLKYFSTYTAHNCWLECLSNYTFKMCGCVGFYMPHIDSHHICNFVRYKCIINAEDELAELEAYGNTSIGCKCLPACNTIDYTAEATVSDFDYKTLWEIEYQGKFHNSFNYSRIVMFFQQPGFIAMRRSKLFGWIDFIANCGGLLGLFLGFSVLSIVEIIYYVTIRLWCTSEQGPKKNKKKPKEIFTIKT